ncbi:MAG: hypothetical protein CJBNEKGG_00164 [Prosthecobacter sp.]|nr:hypothetical protein [Prosthecobacter sp.]
MSFRLSAVLVTAFSCALAASAQQSATPPEVPAGAAKPAVPVAPPMPGQVKAEPTASPSQGRLPEMPAPAISPVPPTPLSKSQGTVPSTSGSGQFIVHGNDLRLRNAFSARCDEIRDELSKLLRDPQPWVLPVVVLLNSGENARQAPRSVSTSLAEVAGGGFHLQVTVNLRPDLRSQDLRAEVVRALLLERVLRSQPAVTSKRTLLLPEWMQVGVIKALDYRKQARPSTLFAAIFKSGRIFGIEEIIEASPTQMDALSRTIYDTSCCALVLALLDQPEGSARLNRFLASLATDARSERELLNLAFPSFASSKASLNKWWALQLANLSRPGLSEPLTPAETLKALEEALTLRYQAKPSEIPRPRPVPVLASLAAPEKERERVVLEPDPAVLVEAGADEPGRLRSFISMLNPFSRRKTSNAAIIESAIEEAAIEEARSQEDQSSEIVAADVQAGAVASEGPRTVPTDERKGFFNRWFGGGDAPEKVKPQEERAAEVEKTEAGEGAAPSGEIVPAGRPSRWNPLNWFRRDKEALESSEAEPGLETSSLDFWRGDHPAALVMQQELVPATPPAEAKPTSAVEVPEDKPQPKKRGFLGIFGSGKKKKDKEAPSAESMPAPEPAPAGPDASKAKADKEESQSEAAAPKKSPPESAPAKEETAAAKKGAPAKATLVPVTEEPPSGAAAKPEGQAMKAGDGAAEADAAPMPAADEKQEAATSGAPGKRGPVTLKSLFGFGKKPEKAGKTEEPEPMPAEGAPPGEDKAKMTAGPDGGTPDAEAKKETPPAEKTSDSKVADKSKKAASSKADAEKAGGKKMEKSQAEAPKITEKAEPRTMEKATPTVTEKPVSKPVEKPEPARPASEPPKAAPSPAPAMAEKPAAPAPKVEPPPPPSKPVEKPRDEPLVAAAVPIEDYAAILKRPDRREILQHNLAALSALQHRSSVLFRPVVTEYTALVAELMEGKARNVDERLQRLRERSRKAYEQSRAVRDLLDVHEANSASAMSGAFEDYLKLPERIQEELPPRQDAISRYLDALDLEFSKP